MREKKIRLDKWVIGQKRSNNFNDLNECGLRAHLITSNDHRTLKNYIFLL